MTRRPALLTAVLLLLLASACWEQFDDPDPVDDDDASPLPDDDDDSSIVDDDDDSSIVDDDDATIPEECLSSAVLACDEAVPGNNGDIGSTNAVQVYGCTATSLSGPEYVYEWLAEGSGDVTVELSGLTEDLDLAILAAGPGGDCDPDACIDSSNGVGDTESVTFAAIEGNRYHFAVDGFNGAISDYTIAVDCSGLPGDDDDAADDDDVADDDDSSAVDDDDATGDDDDATPDCTDPPSVVPTVTLTDPGGTPTTQLSVASPMTVTLSLENVGGGTETQVYGSPCLFAWSLWYPNGDPVGGGPTCTGLVTTVDYVCGAAPTVFSAVVEPIEGVSGNPAPPGTYELQVDTYAYGTQIFSVTVP